jgi:hypothetical protein
MNFSSKERRGFDFELAAEDQRALLHALQA